MIIVDAQLSPILAAWIKEIFNLESASVRALGLREATDNQIFFEARKLKTIILKKMMIL